MSEWLMILLLATGDVHTMPATPVTCAAWAMRVSRGQEPSIEIDGTDVPVVFAMCAQGLKPPKGAPARPPTTKLRGRLE